MPNLYTTYDAVQPPEIISPDTQQNYQEIQALTMPNNLNEDKGLDWNFIEQPSNDPDIKPVQIEQPPIQQQANVDSSAAAKVIDTARQFVGGKYTWGGSSPSTGFDCSGLIQYAFKQVGINLPRTAAAQGKAGQEVDKQSARPGDIIWFGSRNSPSGQHVGLISRIENGQIYIIDAAGKAKGILERPLPNMPIKSIRRLLGGDFSIRTSSGSQVIGSGISTAMANQIKRMEGGNTTAKTNSQFGEKFATGAYGMTREFDRPGAPAIKAGTTFSRERWDSIFNAFYTQRVNEWKQVLQGLPNVTQDKLDALASISGSGNWASARGKFGKFIVQNWNNPQAIYNKWLKSGITAAGNGKVMRGLVKRRYLEANWFFGNKLNFN